MLSGDVLLSVRALCQKWFASLQRSFDHKTFCFSFLIKHRRLLSDVAPSSPNDYSSALMSMPKMSVDSVNQCSRSLRALIYSRLPKVAQIEVLNVCLGL